MATTVIVPAQLRRFTNDQSRVQVDASNVGAALNQLDEQFPGIKDRVCESDGRIRRFVNVFVDGKDVRSQGGTNAALSEESELSIIPAMAGGCAARAFHVDR